MAMAMPTMASAQFFRGRSFENALSFLGPYPYSFARPDSCVPPAVPSGGTD